MLHPRRTRPRTRSLTTHGSADARWVTVIPASPISHSLSPQSILPTIAESLDDRCSVESEGDQPFELNLDNCLLTLIIRSGNPKPQTALLYAAQLVRIFFIPLRVAHAFQLASISSLHAAGVVHGLISPETVAVRDEKYLVLCDCERRARLPNLLSPRDHHHQRMYLYTAPEIILGWTHGPAVDSWGFGLVLYYLLIGFVSSLLLAAIN